ncbi:MAG: O-antigen ligase family protein [Candidatus Omnitrophica bacterium]|nr:O-antigen ligase family protein [Candidatus Omnitrophota bacterium]
MLLIVAMILLIASAVSPFFGLINYTAILYLRPMEVFPALAAYPIARIFILPVIAGFLVKAAIDRKRAFLNYAQDKVLLALLGVIILSFSVGWIPQCLVVLEQMAKNVVVYALIVGLLVSEMRIKIFLWAVLIMSAVLGYNVYIEFRAVQAAQQAYTRIGGFSGGYFGGAGDFAVMMNVAIPIGFYLGVAARPIVLRPLALALMAACAAGMVSTLARGGGMITFGAVSAGLAYFGLRSKGAVKKIFSVGIVITAIVIIAVYAPSAFKDKAGSIANYSGQDTAVSRIEFWKIGIKMFIKSPIIGVGAGNYPLRYWDFGGWEQMWRVPHNMYIEALSELGIMGFGCLASLLFLTFRDGFMTDRLLREKKGTNQFLSSANQAALLSLLAYSVGGMFQSLFTYPILYVIIGVVVAIKSTAVKTAQRGTV